jgi:hypothetical protein
MTKPQSPPKRDDNMTIDINVTDNNISVHYKGHLDRATLVYVLFHELMSQYPQPTEGGTQE